MQSKSFTKLFASITDSSIWSEDNATRIVWITMLAMADSSGYVGASILGLAARARVSVPECEKALAKFLAPDPYSRTRDYDGRRIMLDDGGWTLVNYKRHRDISRDESIKESKRLWAARARARQLNEPSESRSDVLPVEVESKSPSASSSSSGSDLDLGRGCRGEPTGPVPTQLDRSGAGVFDAPTIAVDPKRGRFAPDDFAPNDVHRVRCQELRFDVDALCREFKAFEFNRDYSDWDRRFSRWIEDHRLRVEADKLKADSRAAKGPGSRFGGSGAPVDAHPPVKRLPGLPAWVREAHADAARELGLDLRSVCKGFAKSYHLPVSGLPACDLHQPLLEHIRAEGARQRGAA